MIDVAVIGAGVAGLVCAQQLQQKGYSVVVVEKSRGLGGRLATRRLQETCADHGVRSLEQQGSLTQPLIQALCDEGILTRWTSEIDELTESGILQRSNQIYPRYVAPAGMTAVAKFLAKGLEIWRSQRVQSITVNPEQTWALTLEPAGTDRLPDLIARAVAIAIPAPQALTLLEPLVEQGLSPGLLNALRSVEFAPCLSVIATYPAQKTSLAEFPRKAIGFPQDSDLGWIGLDSSKRQNSQFPVFVVQSSADFAKRYLEEFDLTPAGKLLLARAAQLLLPWLNEPETLQVHRWRYAFASRPLSELYLATSAPLPLVCGGDWCGGSQIESALQSGLAAATQIFSLLQAKPMPESSDKARFIELIQSLR